MRAPPQSGPPRGAEGTRRAPRFAVLNSFSLPQPLGVGRQAGGSCSDTPASRHRSPRWRGSRGGASRRGCRQRGRREQPPRRLLPIPSRRESSPTAFGGMQRVYPALICKLPPGRRVQKAWEKRNMGVRLRGAPTEVVSKGQQPGAVVPRVSGRPPPNPG